MIPEDISLFALMEHKDDDPLTERIHGALREALAWGMAHPSSCFRDRPDGMTEIEGEYDLAFVARVIRLVVDKS